MKPKPFINSVWGIIVVLIIAIVMLGVANYRGYRAGFNLPFTVITANQLKSNDKESGTPYLFTTQTELNNVIEPNSNIKINWDKQIAFGYAITNSSDGHYLQPLTVRRQGAVIDISYQRTVPEDIPGAGFTQVISYPVVLAVLDRTKIIASSELTLNFVINGTTAHTLLIPPNKI